MSTPITDIFNQNKEEEKKSNQSSINQIDFAKAFEVGLQQGQDISPTSFSFLLNTVSSKTGKQATFTFDDKSKEAFKNKYGDKQLKQAETLMAQSLMTNNAVNSVASYYAPNRTVNQLYDPEYAMFFPQAKMTDYAKPKEASIEFEWNGTATPITKFTTEEIADVNSVFYDSYAKQFKPLNKEVINKWESDNWSFDKDSFAEGLSEMFGFDKNEGTERVTLMRNEDIAKLDTEDGRRIKSELALGNLNAKEIFRLQDTDGNFKPVWRTVTQNEDPFDLNNIRSVWGPKTINNNNIAIEALESFNDSFMSALDGAYFTTYGARKLTSPFLSPFLRDSDFNKQLENEYNEYQQWSQGRRSTAAEEESEAWYDNMTNLTKGVANGLGQLISTAGVGFAGKLGTNVLMGASKVAGSKILTTTLSTLPANIARGFSASYAMGAAQQEARRAGLSENESMLMAGLAGVTLQLSEQMIGGNDSWLYRSFLPKEISSKAGKFIAERVQAEAKLAGKTIADTLKNSANRSSIMGSTLKWLTEETDSWWKAGVQSFTQEAFQEVTEDSINKLNQFGFNTVADGLKASGYDWINDEARYKLNLRDTLQELGGSFIIGGLTGGISGSAMTAFNTQQDIDKQLNGAKMNSLVYHYVDNKGNVQDYYDQLDLLKNNELTGSPYVSSKVDRDSKTRTLWSKLGFTDTANTKTTETDASKYAYDVMKTEADWVFGQAQKIESQLKSQGINPWENAQSFGQRITKSLDLQPKEIPDVLMVDSKGKIMTLDEKTYKEVTKNYTPEELSKLQVNVLSPEAATRTKVDLTVRDIQSSVFLEGMSVYNRKNDVQKSLALQLAKRDSNSLFREVNPSDVTAFDGNYKGMMVDRELSYEDEFDREYTTNFNKLRSQPINNVKKSIREQQKLMLEVRDIETQIEELENKARRYGYREVAPEVLTELKLERVEKLKVVEKLDNEINSILTDTGSDGVGFNSGEELNAFKLDLRNLVDYENYINRIADRVKYYESKSQFNRLFNDSTFSQELNKLFNNKKGWSPYDYDEDDRKRKQAAKVIQTLHQRLTIQKGEIETIKQKTIETDKDLENLLQDISKLKFIDNSSREELLTNLEKVNKTPLSKVTYKLPIAIKNILTNEFVKGDLSLVNEWQDRVLSTINLLDNLTEEQIRLLNLAYSNTNKFIEELKSKGSVNLGFVNFNYDVLQERLEEDPDLDLEELIKTSLIRNTPKQLIEAKLKNDDTFQETVSRVIEDFNKQFKEAKNLYQLKNFLENLKEVITPDVDSLLENLIQDNNEGWIITEATTALQNRYGTSELESPKYYRNIVQQLNSILPRLYYTYTDSLQGEDLELYKLATNPKSVSSSTLEKSRQKYKEVIQGKEVHPVVKVVILREELEQVALDLEAALSKRFLQDIDFQYSYIKDKKETLLDFLKRLNTPEFSSIQEKISNFELPTKVIPTGDNDEIVNNYVKETISKTAKFLNLEEEVSKFLTTKHSLTLAKNLFKESSIESKALLFRRFDDKGLKYETTELNESAQLERKLNYLFLLTRSSADYYQGMKLMLSKAQIDKEFIINSPQFFALRQAYSFVSSKPLSTELTNYITEEVRTNIIQYQKETLNSNTEYLIIDPSLITTKETLRWAENIYNLQGIPGVGKTEYLLKGVATLNKYKNPTAKIIVTAPGESQLNTLKSSLKKVEKTLNIEYFTWEQFEKLSKKSLEDYALVIIDESSLLPPNEFVANLDKNVPSSTKVILSGDQLQESPTGVYALYSESNKPEHRATLFISERGETLDVSVRSGLVDLQKYIESIAAYIPSVNNFVGRGIKTVGDSALRNEMKEKSIREVQKQIKPAEFSYYQEGDVTKKGVQLHSNLTKFIEQFKRTRDSGMETYFIMPTLTTSTEIKNLIKELNKLGIQLTKKELDDGSHPFIMLSKYAQGKTLKNVFTPFMLSNKDTVITASSMLSGFFVAASRAVDSLVVYQPIELAELLPFTSTQVSSEAKILTYPPFTDDQGNLSEDTKIRQENFVKLVSKLDTEPIEEQTPDEFEKEEDVIKTEEEQVKDFHNRVTSLSFTSMKDLRSKVDAIAKEYGILVTDEITNLYVLLDTNFPRLDIDSNLLTVEERSTIQTNGENIDIVLQDYPYIAQNESFKNMINKKIEDIKKFEESIITPSTTVTTTDTFELNGKKLTSREFKIERTVNDEVLLKGFDIKIASTITLQVPKQLQIVDDSVTDPTLEQQRLSDHLKALQLIAKISQVVTVNDTTWNDFTEAVEIGDTTLKQILNEENPTETLKDRLLGSEPSIDPIIENIKAQSDLFNFKAEVTSKSTKDSKFKNRQKIAQLVLLSPSEFGAKLEMKAVSYKEGYFSDDNIPLNIKEKALLVQYVETSNVKKKTPTTSATDTETKGSVEFNKKVEELNSRIEKDAQLATEIKNLNVTSLNIKTC